MNALRLPENLAALRKGKRITQEELAGFLGVTKAAVSKWENGQSMPDILLLPQLAAYFGVTLDELVGYEPQLSKEQIQKIYLDFAAAFAARPFADVLSEVRAAVRQYYACHPMLMQLCVLYLNHVFMAKDAQEIQALLREMGTLCDHILKDCKIVSLCSDAASIKAVVDLQLGNAQAVIEALEPALDPSRLSRQDDATLAAAYQLAGQTEQAVDRLQISAYLHLLGLVSASVQYMAVNGGDRKRCEETIRRIDAAVEAYRLEQLNPNVTAQFHYQAAILLTAFGEREQALSRLRAYARTVRGLLGGDRLYLHGDDYFHRLDPWFETLALGANPPRDKALVRQSALQSLSHPSFDPLRDAPEFQAIQLTLERE